MRDSLWLALAVVVSAHPVRGSDWPTYRHDERRTGVSEESLVFENLRVGWRYQSPQPPRTAWPAPARWDAYANIRGLRDMRDYDRAFHPVVAKGLLYFASSVDDSVHCLDAATGEERWVFTTDAPVRVAPTVDRARVYFGSDDGHAYCVSAKDGTLVWKFRPPVEERWILNDGRFVSHWPCRSGVLIEGETAYCTFSLFPWRESYVCAVDALSGRAEGPGRYVRRVEGKTLEGALLSDTQRLIVPQGRVPPFLFSARTGEPQGSLPGGGGSFASLRDDGRVLHGPGNKTGWVTVSDLESRKPVATHEGWTRMTVTREHRFLLSDRRLRALGRHDDEAIWEKRVRVGVECIVAGSTVVVGGLDEVVAFRSSDGQLVWSHAVAGRAHGLAVAAERLFVSTDEGHVYCFQARQKSGDHASLATKVSATVEAAPPPVKRPQPAGLLHRWVFESGMHERATRRGLPNSAQYVEDRGGNRDAVVLGDVVLRQVGGVEALELDGSTNSVLVTADYKELDLPDKELTAEAWVRVDQPQPWAGFIGAVQDNGDFERGWILGYNNAQFSFAVAGREGPGRITYLKAPEEYETGAWYHVVGTYDGRAQRLYVNGRRVAESTDQKGEIHYPPEATVELGAYHDEDQYFRMRGMLHEVLLYKRALAAEDIATLYEAKRRRFPIPIRLETGPYVRFVGPNEATVRWKTREASPTIIEFGVDRLQRLSDPSPKREHAMKLSNLERDRLYSYVIKTSLSNVDGATDRFELDTRFNYTRPRLAPDSRSEDDSARSELYANAAARILEATGIEKGICVVYGCGDGRLAGELARRSELRVIGFGEDATQIEKGRAALRGAGYGTHVTLHRVESLASLPVTGHFANLVVSQRLLDTGECGGNAREIFRILRPQGGAAYLGWPVANASSKARLDRLEKWLAAEETRSGSRSRTEGTWIQIVRGALEGAGDWTHQYGLADNSAFGGETLAGASSVGELAVQWFGRPGPRVQPDRSGRKPSPLATNGRLFVQGMHRLMGLDAYNGTILWSLEIPPMARFNVPRDCGNWCADDHHVFVAVRDRCWQIDAQSGQVDAFHPVIPGDRKEWDYDWSFLAREGRFLMGSAIKKGTSHTNFWGDANAGWYDAASGPVTFKLCSENFFAIDKATGKPAWTRHRGLIINSTITVSSRRVYFVECRNEKARSAASRRVGLPELWENQYLVALDAEKGDVVWERELDSVDGIVVFYMAKGSGRLVIVSSSDKHYDVYAHSDADGQLLWHRRFGWPAGKSDHGKAMSRPAIVGEFVYVRPSVLSLETGEPREGGMPLGGCGTYAATTNSLIFRDGNVTVWDNAGGPKSSWERLRPGCWLSTIPACGMVLSPEAGGGCSCGKWMETSLGFIPLVHTKR